MSYRNQLKSSLFRKSALVLLLLSAVFLLEPAFRDTFSYAVTYFEHPARISDFPETPAQEVPSAQIRPIEKSWAPEPSTLLLLFSGVAGYIVRLAQKSFERFKRLSDIFLSLVGLTITAPLSAFIAILIKLNSKGAVIYKQNRVGKNGALFQIYKFRTMRLDAEKSTGAVWAREDDPRVTSVGRVLRKAHLDEIPQLLNVLKGQMSIVGPRPERPEIMRDLKVLIRDYEKRLQVKPGITGLAQVWHKYDETVEDVKKKIKYDLLYIRKMCILADVSILFNTIVVVLTGRGAR